MKKKKQVEIYDTTLRDGNQALGISLSLTDKLRIAERLADLGVDYIEGGWPTTGNNDLDFFVEARKKEFGSKVAVFGSTRRKGTAAAEDQLLTLLVKSEAPYATLYGKSWDLHVREVLKTSLEENLDMIADSVQFMKKHFDKVFFDAEHFFDGYRENPEFALKCLLAAQEAGADCLVLCDTNGGTLPGDFLEVYKAASDAISTPLGVHTHNDCGCADANAFLGVDHGAVQVQGTMNGLGERCGNANLCTIIPGLQLKRDIELISDEQIGSLTETSIFVSEMVNVAHNVRAPYVGESAFSHKAGTHADGVRKNRRTFEHVDPESVGNFRRFVVSDQAGSATILENLSRISPNLDKKDPLVRQLLGTIQRLESEGYQFEAAEGTFELIARQALGTFKDSFEFKGFRVIEEKRENGDVFSEATIKVQKDTEMEHTAAEGDGPVNALDNAVRKALGKFYPSLLEVKLEDFKVRVLDGRTGTAAKVRVLIESSDGKERWGTIGVSTNVIEASWLALIDSLRYKLMRDGRVAEASDTKKKK